jgi:hypothetical protein
MADTTKKEVVEDKKDDKKAKEDEKEMDLVRIKKHNSISKFSDLSFR